MKIADMPTHARPREKLKRVGTRGLREAELLALILRTGYQGKSALEVAERILKSYSVEQLCALELTQLQRLKGIGASRAATIKAISELAFIISRQESVPMTEPSLVADCLANYRDKSQEYFLGLYLNARREVIAQETISVGTLDSSPVHPREVFAPALLHRAATIILAHNHPSGDSTPSLADLEVTERLIEAGALLDIGIVDHVVIAKNNWTSIRREQLVEFRVPIT